MVTNKTSHCSHSAYGLVWKDRWLDTFMSKEDNLDTTKL
jgi:hypothetical protein